MSWRWLRIEDPKNNLNESYNVNPASTSEPWTLLQSTVFQDPDERTLAVLKQLDRAFFDNTFSRGTLIIVEGFDVQDYEKYFSVASEEKSYLYNYIRYYTAHGDTRRIRTTEGFLSVDVNAVVSNMKSQPPTLWLLMDRDVGNWELVPIPNGYPYLKVTADDEKLATPNEVTRLRDGRFCARYATVLDHGGQRYSLVLAIDAKRRAMDGYRELGRQRNSGCGIPLSTQRGTFLSAHGIKICAYNQLFDADALGDYSVLRDSFEHHVFLIDGPFELVTSRNAPAPASLRVLTDQSFLDKIRLFLTDVQRKRPRGTIFKELIERLGDERTHEREDHYHQMMDHVKATLPDRAMFKVTDVPQLKDKWFFVPAIGEELFVGALFTMFAHLVDRSHALTEYWHRPLTFKSFGIDAISCSDEKKLTDSLEYLEYKHTFATDAEFNHPFSITNVIVCWDFLDPSPGTPVADSYDYVGSIKSFIDAKKARIGFVIADIRLKSGLHAIGREIRVLSLRRLLAQTFKVSERAALLRSKK